MKVREVPNGLLLIAAIFHVKALISFIDEVDED